MRVLRILSQHNHIHAISKKVMVKLKKRIERILINCLHNQASQELKQDKLKMQGLVFVHPILTKIMDL